MNQRGIDGLSLVALPRRDYILPFGKLPRPLLMGIDPGLHGACAVVDCDTHRLVDLIDLPTFRTHTTARKSGHFSHLYVHKLSSLLDSYAPMVSLAVLEEPGAMPGQGLGSTFRFGHICGQIHGVLAGHYIPTVPIKPGVWKSALGLSHEKQDSIDLANKEFPAAAPAWAKLKHNDRAEAVLLAVYAKRYLQKFIALNRR